MNVGRWLLLAVLGLTAIGCDGKDPERLGRVGKKIVAKSRRFAEEAKIPQVTITRPGEKDQPTVSIKNGEPRP